MKLLILFYLFTHPSFALDKCEQMQALTCAPGTLNDGTASVSTTNSVQEKMLDILRTKKPQIHADFLKSLNNASAYDVNYALSATGAAATEECESTLNGGPISPACKNLVATGLTDRVLVELQTGRDPTSEAQRLQGTLEDEFPLRQTELYRSVSDRYLQQISNELGRPQVENHLRKDILPKTISYFNEVINQYVTDAQTKKKLLTKINAIRFGGMDCSENKSGGLNSEFETNAFYDGSSNKFYFCKGYEKFGLSDFNAVHTIAHELAHSIDPCLIQNGPSFYRFNYEGQNPQALESQFPFPNLVTCLRDQRSIAASNGEDIPGGMSPAEMREPAPGENTKPFCTEGEQIGESFCDWIGTEIITRFSQNEWKGLSQRQYQNGIANIWRSACQPGVGLTNNSTGGPHPPSGMRLTKLILPHPYIRKRLNCGPLNESRDIYCNPATYEPPPQPAEMYDDSGGEYEETER